MPTMIREEFQKLQNQRNELNTKLQSIAKDIGEAASRGDLSENSEFDDAKERRDRCIERIRELDKQLSEAVLIDKNDLPSDIVCIGKRVRIRGLESLDVDVKIVSSRSNDDEVTPSSPLGKAIIGKKVGDKTKMVISIGVLDLEIMSVDVDA